MLENKQCQDLTPKEQYEKGIRYVDIRLAPINNSSDTLGIWHEDIYMDMTFD